MKSKEPESVENTLIGSRRSPRKTGDLDTRSTGSKKAKRSGTDEPKLFEGPPGFKQATLEQIPVPTAIQIKDPNVSLEEAWNLYGTKKREFKQAKKHYNILRAALKYTRTPPDSDTEA